VSNAEVGAQAERMALAYLRGHFPGLERTRATSLTKAERYQKHPDIGDITGLTDWAIEVKSMGQVKLAQAVDQAASARLVKGVPWSVVIVRRKQAAPERWYAVTELGQWAAMAAMLDGGCDETEEALPEPPPGHPVWRNPALREGRA